MDQLWDWSKVYGIDTDRGSYLGVDKRINFENFWAGEEHVEESLVFILGSH